MINQYFKLAYNKNNMITQAFKIWYNNSMINQSFKIAYNNIHDKK